MRAVTGAAGAVVERHDYRPFGEDTMPLPAPGADPTRFLGQQRDQTKLDQFGARYYSMFRGRFMGVDPVINAGAIASPQRWNRYAYALNNPLRFTDVSGLDPAPGWAAGDPDPVFVEIDPGLGTEMRQTFDDWAEANSAAWRFQYVYATDGLDAALDSMALYDVTVTVGTVSSDWMVGSEGQLPVAGAQAGAAIGTLILPGAGTLIGGAIGAGVGLWVGWEVGGALAEWYFSKPPADAYDPFGPKAPGKPPASVGFRDPRGGETWGKTANGQRGWLSDKGEVWVPTGWGRAPHGGPHWDVIKGRDHRNVFPPRAPSKSGG